MSRVVLEREFEDGATFEMLEFLCDVEERTASMTAFIQIDWVGGNGHPKRARLLEDDEDFAVEMTDGEWDADGDEPGGAA